MKATKERYANIILMKETNGKIEIVVLERR